MDDTAKKEAYSKAFFQKLAEAGITVDNDETAANLLELAQKTRLIKQASERRQTRTVGELAKVANANLDRILGGDAALDSLTKAAAACGKGKAKCAPGKKAKK